MGHVVGSLFSAPALGLFLMSLFSFFFFSFLVCPAFFDGCEEEEEERIVCFCEFQILMFGPPPVCPFKPLLVECQFLMVFPQFGWGRVDSFSGVPGRVLCSSLSLSLSLSLKRIDLSILRLYSFVGCCCYLSVFLKPFSSFKSNSLVQ
jgi:hypothetical protein